MASRAAHRAWSPSRIALTLAGVVVMGRGAVAFAEGVVFFLLVFTLPWGILLMALGLAGLLGGLALAGVPWLAYLKERRKARAAA